MIWAIPSTVCTFTLLNYIFPRDSLKLHNMILSSLWSIFTTHYQSYRIYRICFEVLHILFTLLLLSEYITVVLLWNTPMSSLAGRFQIFCNILVHGMLAPTHNIFTVGQVIKANTEMFHRPSRRIMIRLQRFDNITNILITFRSCIQATKMYRMFHSVTQTLYKKSMTLRYDQRLRVIKISNRNMVHWIFLWIGNSRMENSWLGWFVGKIHDG